MMSQLTATTSRYVPQVLKHLQKTPAGRNAALGFRQAPKNLSTVTRTPGQGILPAGNQIVTTGAPIPVTNGVFDDALSAVKRGVKPNPNRVQPTGTVMMA